MRSESKASAACRLCLLAVLPALAVHFEPQRFRFKNAQLVLICTDSTTSPIEQKRWPQQRSKGDGAERRAPSMPSPAGRARERAVRGWCGVRIASPARRSGWC